MKRLLYILILILSIVSLWNCSSNDFEKFYLTEVSKDTTSIEFLKAAENLENYLIENNFIKKNDRKNYSHLMNQAIKDEVVLMTDERFYNKTNAWALLENFSFGQRSFIGAMDMWKGKIDTTSAAYKLSQFQIEMNIKGDLADSTLNSNAIESISDSDFKKIIYRAPFIYIIFQILQENYSRFHKWIILDNIYFQNNEIGIDFKKSNLDQLDSICNKIKSNSNTRFYFLALGMESNNDSINYELSVERTKYIEKYLIEEKGLLSSQIIPSDMLRHKIRFKDCKELYNKKNAQLYYYMNND